jgi:hypothetical protein
VNTKQAKRARAVAHAEATRTGLWANLAASLVWWRRILARIFPKYAKRYNDWIGRAYKRNLAEMKGQVAAKVKMGNWIWSDGRGEYILAGDNLHNARLPARLRRKWEAKRAKERVTINKGGS